MDPTALWKAVKESNKIIRKPAAQLKQIDVNNSIVTHQNDIAHNNEHNK